MTDPSAFPSLNAPSSILPSVRHAGNDEAEDAMMNVCEIGRSLLLASSIESCLGHATS